MIEDKKCKKEHNCSCDCHKNSSVSVKTDVKCENHSHQEHGENCSCKHHGHDEGHCHDEHCGCGCGSEHGSIGVKQILFYLAGAVLLLLAFLGEFEFLNKYVAIACAAVVYLFFCKDVWAGAVKGILHKRIFTEFTLMCVATLGAIALGEFADAAAVIYLYSFGESVSGEAYSRSKRNISELIEITEDNVTVVKNGTSKTMLASQVEVGDVISVRVGDRISLDGVVVEGGGFTDTSAITGESTPRELEVGSECLSGSTLLSGAICIKVEKNYENSTANKLKKAVERASKQKAVREKKITRFASVFTPIAFGVAVVVLAVSWAAKGDFFGAVRSALVVLVASCPCSLVLSVPLAYFSGIGHAAKRGIVFRGGQTIDDVSVLDTLVFDKTGTLTSSEPSFVGVMVSKESGLSKTELLDISKAALLKSPHASARAFCEKYAASVVYKADEAKNIGGRGVICRIGGKPVALGNRKFMSELGVKADAVDNSAIYVAVSGVLCGVLLFDAELKQGASEQISKLRGNGVRRVAVISGDNEKSVRSVGDKIGVDELYFELKPDEKLDRLDNIYKEAKKSNPRGTVGFCGDGLNDSAAVARADVGIAMGSGSSLTVESADVVIVDDGLARLNDMVSVAKKTVGIVNQNIALSLVAKFLVVLVGAIWLPSLELAVVADVGVAVLTVLNAVRAGK